MTDLNVLKGLEGSAAFSPVLYGTGGSGGVTHEADQEQASRMNLRDPKALEALTSAVNDTLASLPNKISFTIEGNHPIVKVVDSNGKVVRSLPPEELLDMAEKLRKFQQAIGLLVDEKR